METIHQPPTLSHDLGTFEGFNFREDGAIERPLTADEALTWDHDASGEAEFWPSGDHCGVSLVFAGKTAVTASDLLSLNRVLSELGDDGETAFLRIHFACSVLGLDLHQLTGREVEDQSLQIFTGSSFWEVRKDAAYELFETFFPEHFKFWDTEPHGILTFDWDQFLDGPLWSVHEVDMGNQKALLVAPA